MRNTIYKVKRLNNSLNGFSLVEMLVVIFVFSILGIVTTQVLALSLRGAKKSESIGEVRANVEYTVSTMERLLRNAKSINCVSATRLDYIDERGNTGQFNCVDTGTESYIASGSASLRITSNKVKITCASIFSCTFPANAPPSVSITLTGRDAVLESGVEGSSVTVNTQMQLRTYTQN